MKKIIFASVILLSQTLFGQELMNLVSNNEISIISYWNKGERASYECTRLEKSFKNKKKPNDEKTTNYNIDLLILDSSEHSYSIQLSYSNFTETKNKEEELCYSLLSQLAIKYTTDEYGAFDSIVNKKELRSVLEKLITELNRTVKDTSAIVFMKQLFLNDDNLEALFISDIISIHNLYGIGLELSQPVGYDLEFLTLESYELKGEGKIILNSIDKSRDIARINVTQKPNKEGLEQYILFLMKTLGLKGSSKGLKVTNRVTQSYEMELSSGWMKKIKSKSVSKVTYEGKSSKKEVINTFELEN